MILTTSLETSKILKEAGINAFAQYKWCGLKTSKYILNQEIPNTEEIKWFLIHESDPRFHAHSKEWVPESYYAYSTDELLSELPKNLDGNKLRITFFTNGACEVWYAGIKPQVNDILPEALAQMWLWLKKEGLI